MLYYFFKYFILSKLIVDVLKIFVRLKNCYWTDSKSLSHHITLTFTRPTKDTLTTVIVINASFLEISYFFFALSSFSFMEMYTIYYKDHQLKVLLFETAKHLHKSSINIHLKYYFLFSLPSSYHSERYFGLRKLFFFFLKRTSVIGCVFWWCNEISM